MKDLEEFIMNVFLSKFCIMDYDETDEEIKEEARKRSCESYSPLHSLAG